MGGLDELCATIVRTLHSKSAVRAAWPDLDMEAMAPALRRQEVAARQVFDARLATLSSGLAVLSKLKARIDDAQDRRAHSVRSIDEMRRRAETERSHGGSEAWRLGADWLSGKVGGGDMPGGVIAMTTEIGSRLQPLQVIDDELAKLQSDIAPHVTRLQAELDAWVVRGSIDAVLPAMESHIDATVTARD